MATTHTYSGLTDAVEARQNELIVKGSLGAPSLRTFDIYTNVKGKTVIPSLDTTVEFQDGAVCSFNANGSDVWGEVTLDPVILKVDKSWCFRAMSEKVEAWNNKLAIGMETAPYEEEFINNQLGAINEALDEAIWQGVSGITTGITEMLAGSGALSASTSSADTVSAVVDKVYALIPAKAYKAGKNGKVRMYMGYTEFGQYIQSLNSTCCAKVGLIDGAVDELAYPYDSRVILTPVVGLEGADYIVAAPEGGLAYGTDVEGSENIFRFKQDERQDDFFLKVAFKEAVAIKMPFYTVYAHLA